MTRVAVNPVSLAAGIALAVLASVWGWWAATDGAPSLGLHPGLIVLCAALILASSRAAWPRRLEVPLGPRIAGPGMLRFLSPLTVGEPQIDRALEVVGGTLAGCRASSGQRNVRGMHEDPPSPS